MTKDALAAKELGLQQKKKVCRGRVLKTPKLLRPEQRNPLFNQQRVFIHNEFGKPAQGLDRLTYFLVPEAHDTVEYRAPDLKKHSLFAVGAGPCTNVNLVTKLKEEIEATSRHYVHVTQPGSNPVGEPSPNPNCQKLADRRSLRRPL